VKDKILEVRKAIPEKICKKIISYYNYQFEDAKIVTGVDKRIRNCQLQNILEPKTFGEKIITNYIKSKIFQITEAYKQKNPYLDINKISQLDILKYEHNSYDAGYKYHTDFDVTAQARHISISITLNSDFEGGEFIFDFDENIVQYPQNVGDALLFPSNFLFPHQVNKITKGTRYALIAWVI